MSYNSSVPVFRLAELNVDYTITFVLAGLLALKYVFFDSDPDIENNNAAEGSQKTAVDDKVQKTSAQEQEAAASANGMIHNFP